MALMYFLGGVPIDIYMLVCQLAGIALIVLDFYVNLASESKFSPFLLTFANCSMNAYTRF